MDPIKKLIKGYAQYRDGYYRENEAYLVELGEQGQSPKIAVIACCDSRVDPAVITNSAPGELFVIRNVANLVPPCEGQKMGSWHGTSAAIQYAVCNLEVEHLIILGHANCGGIQSLVEQSDLGVEGDGFIGAWMSIVKDAQCRVLADTSLDTLDKQARACEKQAVKISLNNLMTFPWIKDRVEADSLSLHGWHYNLLSGELLSVDAAGEWEPVVAGS
jgi:carbonic anhydrase